MEKKIVESIPDTNTPGTNTTIFDKVDPIVSVPGINVDYAFDEEEDEDKDEDEDRNASMKFKAMLLLAWF